MASPLRFNPGELPYVTDSGGSYVAGAAISATGPALLYGFSGFNSKGSAQYIMIFDSATLPAESTAAKIILYVQATSSFSYDPGENPDVFTNGIYWTNSSTSPTKTIGSTDCFLRAKYKN